MPKNIHPQSRVVTLHCSNCGTDFTLTANGLDSDRILAENCSNCHSAWTGKRVISTQGAVAAFQEKFKDFGDQF